MMTQEADSNRIDVVFGIDDSYTDPFIVTAYSIIRNNTSFKEVHIHIITSGISEKNRRKIKQLEADYPGVFIEFALVDEGPFKEFPLHIKHISAIAYGRFLTADLFRSIKKALYLDADLLVLDDLKGLWDVDLRGKCIAGSHKAYINTQFPGYKESIGLSADSTYINSGVMLMNLSRIRELGKTQELLRNAKELKDIVRIQDQDIINITFQGEIIRVESIYNCTDSDRREGSLSTEDVKIAHFNTRNKPWEDDFVKDQTNKIFAEKYIEYQNEAFGTKV